MKMRKVISLFTALVLSVSAFSTIALAGPAGSITCKTNVTSMTPAEAGALIKNYGSLSDDDYDIYLLTISITGRQFTREDGFSGVSGDLLTGFEVNYVTEDNSNIFAAGSAFNAMSKTYAGYNKNTKTISYQLTNTSGDAFIDDMTTVSASDETVMGKTIIALKQGTSVTFNVTSAASAATFEDGSVVTGTDGALPVNLDSTTLKIGTTKPAGPTFTDDTQTTMAKDAEKVNADGTYNVGVKADAIVVPAGSNATKIKFGFSTDDATALRTTASYEVTLPTAVQSGAVSVALNVTSVPEGVTLTYTGATVE